MKIGAFGIDGVNVTNAVFIGDGAQKSKRYNVGKINPECWVVKEMRCYARKYVILSYIERPNFHKWGVRGEAVFNLSAERDVRVYA